MAFKERLRELKRDIPAVYFALRDPALPLAARIAAGLTVAYALSPIDLIPDFIPVLGALDDALLLPLLVALTVKLIPAEIWQRSKAASENLWADGKPKKWFFAVPIVLLWLLLLGLVVKAVLG